MTAQQILENKGYDNSECSEIISSNENCLDEQIREKYGVDSLPLHLWADYSVGDADEQELLTIANLKGFDESYELLEAMDADLIELAENYPSK